MGFGNYNQEKEIVIRAKFKSRCKGCGCEVREGEKVLWQPGVKGVLCSDCIREDPYGELKSYEYIAPRVQH